MLAEDLNPHRGNVRVGVRPLRADPCRGLSSFSWARFFLFAVLFLTMVPGSCPTVRRELPRLALRHAAFLIALFVLQATALGFRSHLSTYWLTPNGRGHTSPFAGLLLFLCLGIGLTEIITNRSLLDKAHLEYAGWPVRDRG